jgi:hypothetical protein
MAFQRLVGLARVDHPAKELECHVIEPSPGR